MAEFGAAFQGRTQRPRSQYPRRRHLPIGRIRHQPPTNHAHSRRHTTSARPRSKVRRRSRDSRPRKSRKRRHTFDLAADHPLHQAPPRPTATISGSRTGKTSNSVRRSHDRIGLPVPFQYNPHPRSPRQTAVNTDQRQTNRHLTTSDAHTGPPLILRKLATTHYEGSRTLSGDDGLPWIADDTVVATFRRSSTRVAAKSRHHSRSRAATAMTRPNPNPERARTNLWARMNIISGF